MSKDTTIVLENFIKEDQLRDHANMAEKKARCFQFKVLPGTRLRNIKNTIKMQIDDNYITVFHEIGAHKYLVELARATHTNEFIEHGLDVDDLHFNCHPPPGYYVNVSIMG